MQWIKEKFETLPQLLVWMSAAAFDSTSNGEEVDVIVFDGKWDEDNNEVSNSIVMLMMFIMIYRHSCGTLLLYYSYRKVEKFLNNKCFWSRVLSYKLTIIAINNRFE